MHMLTDRKKEKRVQFNRIFISIFILYTNKYLIGHVSSSASFCVVITRKYFFDLFYTKENSFKQDNQLYPIIFVYLTGLTTTNNKRQGGDPKIKIYYYYTTHAQFLPSPFPFLSLSNYA